LKFDIADLCFFACLYRRFIGWSQGCAWFSTSSGPLLRKERRPAIGAHRWYRWFESGRCTERDLPVQHCWFVRMTCDFVAFARGSERHSHRLDILSFHSNAFILFDNFMFKFTLVTCKLKI